MLLGMIFSMVLVLLTIKVIHIMFNRRIVISITRADSRTRRAE